MNLRFDPLYIKITAASLFVMTSIIISGVLIFGEEKREAVNVSQPVKAEQKAPVPQEIDEQHLSWQISSAESAGLVDSDSGFKTLTIGE